MKFSADFDSFLRTEVNLNQSRLDRLQSRVDSIESFISTHEIFSDCFRAMIPTGSWAHRTIIKPARAGYEFDADVLLFLDTQTDWNPRDYIEFLYSAFRSSGTYTSLPTRKTRCVRIDYAGDFHIDIVPFVERNGSHYISNRHEPAGTGCFELANPEGFTQWIEEKQRVSKGTFIKVVRLLKFLRDHKTTFSCKSIILTVMLGSLVDEAEAASNPELYADVPSALVSLCERLADTLPVYMPPVYDPAGTGDNFTERYGGEWNYDNFRKRVKAYAGLVREAYDETDRSASIAVWQQVFGDKFKPGSLQTIKSLAPLSASVPWGGEEFIDRPPYSIAMAPHPSCKVRITGQCNGFRSGQVSIGKGFRKFKLASSGNRVPKNRSLLFTATTNVRAPYEIFWKVRNGGEEANQARQLRGEISRDKGSASRIETTLYKGSHYVECYVVKDGVVVALDRQPVIVT
jgi:Second Messenger Oligonucleotide or Dinucleotide Synthetase domain/Adenylyl/Guanylyl and SMODS C-terminal sensor domain